MEKVYGVQYCADNWHVRYHAALNYISANGVFSEYIAKNNRKCFGVTASEYKRLTALREKGKSKIDRYIFNGNSPVKKTWHWSRITKPTPELEP